MPGELLIRAGHNDHRVIEDLLAPRIYWNDGAPAIDRLVVDMTLATREDSFAAAASDAGVPLVIDPQTLFLQVAVDPDDSWCALAYGCADPVPVGEFMNPGRRLTLVEQVVDAQMAAGASVVVAPYVYASAPDDPWFSVALGFVRDTAQYVASHYAGVPVVPVLAAQAQSFARESDWEAGLARFGRLAAGAGAQTVAVALSPVGADDKYDKVLRYIRSILYLKSEFGLRTVAWNQGILGAAVVAAGADGYETGIGQLESTDLASRRRSKRPGRGKSDTYARYKGVYLDTLGSSIPHRAAEVILNDERLRPQTMCVDEACCPTPTDTLDNYREHTVRARARKLRELNRQPHVPWRLVQIIRDCEQSLTVAKHSNQALEQAGETYRVKLGHHESLLEVALHLRNSGVMSASA